MELPLIKTQKYHYDLLGLNNVFLDNIEVYGCTKCETRTPVLPKILKLHETIGYAIVCKNGLLSGVEIRFLRKNLRIKSQDWAKLLRTDKSVYSRWESGQKISPQSDLLIRYLYVRLVEEKKEIRLEEKIVEKLAETTDEKTAIVIDVEKIEYYSYMPLTEAQRLAESEEGRLKEIPDPRSGTFDYFGLDESNLFLGEIERLLPPEKMNYDPLNPLIAKAESQQAANQELALAA
jgi:DNA-binding transcriptional regulator YiaG